MSKVPIQKPGKSEQSVGTPPEFINKVKDLLGIESFGLDIAADDTNSVSWNFYTETQDAFKQESWGCDGWSWLNPPYSKIGPWVERAENEALNGAKIAVLVPASVGSLWWYLYVADQAHVLYLRPRLTFVGHKDPYPKDLALLLYTKYIRGGDFHWHWKE